MNEIEQQTDYRIRETRAVLERRIEALERHNLGLRLSVWGAPIVAVVALVVALLTASRSDELHRLGSVAPALEAQAFVLRDDMGVQRAGLSLVEDGSAAFSIQDESGRTRVRLSVLGDGSPGVSLLDADGNSRAVLGLLPDGTTTLVFADGASVARSVMALTPDGAARLVFSDAEGSARTAMGVDERGRPEVSTLRSSGEESSGNDESGGS